MEKYIDNVVIKLKRKYSKDELVSHLIKELSEAKVEIGVLQSEKEELSFKLQKTLKLDPNTKARVGQMNLFLNLKEEVKALRKKLRSLKLENEKMFQKIIQNNLEKQK